MKKTIHYILAILVILTIFSCEDRPRTNPFDSHTELDTMEWAPSNLQAVALSNSEIKLTWKQEVKQISGFRIERSINRAQTWSRIAEVRANVNQYIDTGLSFGNYTYRLYAYTTNDQSGYSNTVEIYLFTTGTVTDIDGNVYKTIKIGNQWWMAENLKVTHYRNGDAIPNVTDSTEWRNLITGAYCNYDNDENNVDTYGRLYNWYAVNDGRNIAPVGWHVPSDEEWKQLEIYLGMSQSDADEIGWRGVNEGGKLKETGTAHWNSPNAGASNKIDFAALPGGCLRSYSGFFDLHDNAYFMSSTEISSSTVWSRALSYNNSEIYRGSYSKKTGYSIRCVKD